MEYIIAWLLVVIHPVEVDSVILDISIPVMAYAERTTCEDSINLMDDFPLSNELYWVCLPIRNYEVEG